MGTTSLQRASHVEPDELRLGNRSCGSGRDQLPGANDGSSITCVGRQAVGRSVSSTTRVVVVLVDDSHHDWDEGGCYAKNDENCAKRIHLRASFCVLSDGRGSLRTGEPYKSKNRDGA